MSAELSPEQLQQLYLSSLVMGRKRQQPLLSIQAHVFHINPETKKTWLPVTESAVPVSFFYDAARAMYRIISVDGTKAVVNSCMRSGMTFTKTSQKFGQWTDGKSNAVYGLGFHTEADLDKFQEQFDEIRQAVHLSVSSPQRIQSTTGINSARLAVNNSNSVIKCESDGPTPAITAPINTDVNANSIYQLRRPLVSGCGIGSPCKIKVDSPKRVSSIQCMEKEEEGRNTPETLHLKQENEKLRSALQQSSANSKLWEIELSNLKASNNRLTSTLQECAINVEEWKAQLESYKRENQRLKQQIADVETAAGDNRENNNNRSQKLLEQVDILRQRSDALHRQLKLKEDEVAKLKEELHENESSASGNSTIDRTLQFHEDRNHLLLEINSRLAMKLGEIADIQQKMADVLQSSEGSDFDHFPSNN